MIFYKKLGCSPYFICMSSYIFCVLGGWRCHITRFENLQLGKWMLAKQPRTAGLQQRV